MSRNKSRNDSRIRRLRLLVGLLATGLSFAALAAAQSVPYPKYSPGENTNASTGPTYSQPLPNPWVVSDGAIITPAGTQVYLGITTRAKAVALNPTGNHTAAVLQMGAPQAVTIFNTQTGVVLQTYKPFGDSTGNSTGINYTPDGKYLLFSQDGAYSAAGAHVAIASVDPATGLLSDYAHVSVPIDIDSENYLTNVTASRTALVGPRAALISRAARPSQSCQTVHLLPIPWASRSRRTATPLTPCWTTTIR